MSSIRKVQVVAAGRQEQRAFADLDEKPRSGRTAPVPGAEDVVRIAGPSLLNASPPGEADALFCRLTDEANQAFAMSDDAASDRLYDRALAEAERLFDAARAGGSPLVAPMAYTIASHNIAEAKKRAGDPQAAYAAKRRAVEKLVATAESPMDPLPLRVNCIRHLRHALAFLAEDIGETDHASIADANRLYERCRATGEEITRVAKHVLSERPGAEAAAGARARSGRLN